MIEYERTDERVARICPLCGETYTVPPAMSRISGEAICPLCGAREALEGLNISADEVEKILKLVREHTACQ